MKKITTKEYEKALEAVRLYEYQAKPKKVNVSVTYKANVTMHIELPADLTLEEIKEEVTGGPFYTFNKQDEDDIQYGQISELIVDGEEIKL